MKRQDAPPQEQVIPSAFNPMGEATQDRAKMLEVRQQHLDLIEWLERLVANEDFERFITFVEKGAAKALSAVGDIDNRDPQTRDAYSQRFVGLDAMVKWPQVQLSASREVIHAIDLKLRSTRAV